MASQASLLPLLVWNGTCYVAPVAVNVNDVSTLVSPTRPTAGTALIHCTEERLDILLGSARSFCTVIHHGGAFHGDFRHCANMVSQNIFTQDLYRPGA